MSEAEGAHDADVGEAEIAAADPARSRQFALERFEPRRQLPLDPRDPRLVPLFQRPQRPLVVALHRLLHHREREPGRAQRFEPRGGRARRQRGDGGRDRGEIVEDDARIHQHRSVVGDEGRRLEQRIDFRKFVDVAEQRDRPMRERNPGGEHRHRHAPHIGRIEHADQFHGDRPLHRNRKVVRTCSEPARSSRSGLTKRRRTWSRRSPSRARFDGVGANAAKAKSGGETRGDWFAPDGCANPAGRAGSAPPRAPADHANSLLRAAALPRRERPPCAHRRDTTICRIEAVRGPERSPCAPDARGIAGISRLCPGQSKDVLGPDRK